MLRDELPSKSLKKSKFTTRSGLTLVEVMVAVVLFGLMAAGLCQGFLFASRMSEISLRNTVARDVAQTILEQTRNTPCAALRDGTTIGCDVFGTAVTITKGTATPITVDYRYTAPTTDNMTVTVTLTTSTQNPTAGEAIVVGVDYSWFRLREGVDARITKRLAYIKSGFRDGN